MVDALVSGASALRHVGSSPILGTINKSSLLVALIYCAQDRLALTVAARQTYPRCLIGRVATQLRI